MQTFLPYADFIISMKCLDYRRLGKQRVEAKQLINIIDSGRVSGGWVNHPACKMWRLHPEALKAYYNVCLDEWIHRGYKNTMEKYEVPESYEYPSWFGNEAFHASHRSNLLRKDPDFYGKFNWSEESNLEYIWPI